MKQSPTPTLVPAVVILLMTTALASALLTVDAVWFDEVMTYFFLGAGQFEPVRDLAGFFEWLLLADRWPPLYYLLYRQWGLMVGWSPTLGRIFSLYFGLLTLATTWRVAQDFAPSGYKNLLSRLAGIILATSAFWMYYNHELRGYTLYPFLFMLTFWLYWKVSERPRSRGLGVAFMGVTLLGLYTHLAIYPMVFTIGVYHLLFRRKDAVWGRVLVWLVCVAILTVPWLVVTWYKIQQGLQIGVTSNGLIMRSLLPSFGNGVAWVLAIGLVASGFMPLTRKHAYLIWVLFGSLGVTLLINAYSPFLFHLRHIIGLLPLLMIVLAGGMIRIMRWNRLLGVGLLVVWMGSGIWNSFHFDYMNTLPGHEPTLPIQTAHLFTRLANDCLQAEDAVLLHVGIPYRDGEEWEWIHDIVMTYYWQEVDFRFSHIGTLQPITNGNPVLAEERRYQITDLATYTDALREFIGDAPRVWLIDRITLPRDDYALALMGSMDALDWRESVVLERDGTRVSIFTPDDLTRPNCTLD
ncbi:MAG: glycosyltransferase family 39 protein [Phototrophicaceae bacterium]